MAGRRPRPQHLTEPTTSGPASATPTSPGGDSASTDARPTRIDPRRGPDALSNAISRRWRPYRFRAYALGVLAGLFFGGFVAPFPTTLIALVLAVTTSLPALTFPWAQVVWMGVFVFAFARVASWAIARWLPRDFRAATESYLWLVLRAEAHWRTVMGVPVPRTAAAQRAFLETAPVTPATAGLVGSIWLSLGDIGKARELFAQMPGSTPAERHEKTAALWLAEFVAGGDADLTSLEASLRQVWDGEAWLDGAVEIAVNASRVAIATGGDWIAPMAAVRSRLGDVPARMMWHVAARPAFRQLLVIGSIGVLVVGVVTLVR